MEREPKTVRLCEDGKYRWTYEFAMLRNPILFLTVLKVFFWVLVGMTVFFVLIGIGDAESFSALLSGVGEEVLILGAILLGLSILGYFILALLYGFHYQVLFEMDEEGVRHVQMPKQFKKAEAIGWLTSFAGLAANNPGTVGTGLLAMSKSESYSAFSKVRRIRPLPAFHTIKLSEPMNYNQVYADPGDYAFVLSYIEEHINVKK